MKELRVCWTCAHKERCICVYVHLHVAMAQMHSACSSACVCVLMCRAWADPEPRLGLVGAWGSHWVP